MTPNPPSPNPPAPAKPGLWKTLRHKLRMLYGMLCMGGLAFALIFLLALTHSHLPDWGLWALQTGCIIAGILFILSVIYTVVRIAATGIVRIMEIVGIGRLSPLTLSWFTAVGLGVWLVFLTVMMSVIISLLGRVFFGEDSIAEFLAQMTLWILSILFNPLALLVAVRYIQAKRQIASRLLLIQAAGLVNAGVDPRRALAQVEPFGTYLDEQQYAIAQELQQDGNFARALNRCIPYLSSEDKALLLAGERMGVLGPVLTQKSHDLQDQSRSSVSGFIPSIIVMEWSAMIVLVLMIMTFIIPKFEMIFEDFGTGIPLLTKGLLYATKYLMGTMPEQAVPGVIYILLFFMAIPLLLLVWPVIKGALGQIAVWARIPVVRDAVVRAGLADACLFLGHALRAGVDLPGAVAQTRTLKLSGWVRGRLLAWETDMRAGIAPADAAQKAGLPPVMAAFIRSAQNGPAMGDALERLGRYYRDQTSRTWIVIENLAMPVAILVTGITIGWVVIALFVPMVKLMQRLT